MSDFFTYASLYLLKLLLHKGMMFGKLRISRKMGVNVLHVHELNDNFLTVLLFYSCFYPSFHPQLLTSRDQDQLIEFFHVKVPISFPLFQSFSKF